MFSSQKQQQSFKKKHRNFVKRSFWHFSLFFIIKIENHNVNERIYAAHISCCVEYILIYKITPKTGIMVAYVATLFSIVNLVAKTAIFSHKNRQIAAEAYVFTYVRKIVRCGTL